MRIPFGINRFRPNYAARTIGLLTISILPLACGGSAQTLASLDELKAKYEEVVGPCKSWIIKEKASATRAGRGRCNDDATLSLFPSKTETMKDILQNQLLLLSAGELTGASTGGLRIQVVVGSNWTIVGVDEPNLEPLAKALKGEVVDLASEDATKKYRDSITESSSTGGMAELVPICTKTPLTDNSSSITFDTKGSDDRSGDEYLDVLCTLRILGAPTYVVDLMNSTRALDGRQTESWEDYRASWTYHPDSGLQMTIIHDK